MLVAYRLIIPHPLKAWGKDADRRALPPDASGKGTTAVRRLLRSVKEMRVRKRIAAPLPLLASGAYTLRVGLVVVEAVFADHWGFRHAHAAALSECHFGLARDGRRPAGAARMLMREILNTCAPGYRIHFEGIRDFT